MERKELIAFMRGEKAMQKGHIVMFHVNDDGTVIIESCEPDKSNTFIRFAYFDGSTKEPEVSDKDVREAVDEFLKSA